MKKFSFFVFVFFNLQVTVFDFSTILERTEKRVEYDLLGAGPKTVDELRSIEGRLRLKYKAQLERKIQRAKEKQGMESGNITAATGNTVETTTNGSTPKANPSPQFKDAMDKASNFAGGLFAKVKGRLNQPPKETVVPSMATIVDLPPSEEIETAAAAPEFAAVPTTETKAPPVAAAPKSGNSATFSDGDWTGADIAAATDGIMNFSIGDDDDDDADLLL